MKTLILIASASLLLTANAAFAQDIPVSQVPSVVSNKFQQTFPKASDVEWELEGEKYKVEFETGIPSYDHDVWFDQSGKIIRHKEEISKKELPEKVQAKIRSDFDGYRVDDATKIVDDGKTSYTLELKSAAEEWKVAFDADGNVLSKVAD